MNPLIKWLVQERASQDATPENIERNFDVLKTDRYYHFNITVKAGVSKVNVVCDRALAIDPSCSKAVTHCQNALTLLGEKRWEKDTNDLTISIYAKPAKAKRLSTNFKKTFMDISPWKK